MSSSKSNLLYKLGIPSALVWGYIGVILFMLGSCIENSWLSSYLVNIGISKTETGTIFSLYGIFVAIVSWLSGIFVQIFGVRKVMLSGVIIFLVSSIPLVLWAIPSGNFMAIAITYMLRGMAYPLFVYSFLVWVTYRSTNEIMGRATSWFWVCFNLGITIVGPSFAATLIPSIGEINVIWVGIAIALAGTFCSLVLNRDQLILPKTGKSITNEISEGFLIMFKRPRLGMGMLVKAINNIAQFGFIIIMPIFLINQGFTLTQWASIWGLTYIINSFANVLFGYIGDKCGWRKTIVYIGGPLTGISCLMLYYTSTLFPGQYGLLLLSFSVYAIGLGAFGPISALLPALAPDKKAVAVSVLNLGSGLSNFIGPAIVSLLFEPFGVKVVLYVFAILYFVASFLAFFLRTPEELNHAQLKHEKAVV